MHLTSPSLKIWSTLLQNTHTPTHERRMQDAKSILFPIPSLSSLFTHIPSTPYISPISACYTAYTSLLINNLMFRNKTLTTKNNKNKTLLSKKYYPATPIVMRLFSIHNRTKSCFYSFYKNHVSRYSRAHRVFSS